MFCQHLDLERSHALRSRQQHEQRDRLAVHGLEVHARLADTPEAATIRLTARAFPCGIATPFPIPVVWPFLAVHHAQQDLAVAVEAVRGLEQVHQLGDRLALAARAKPRRDRLGVEQFGEAHGTVPWVAVGTCGQGSQPRGTPPSVKLQASCRARDYMARRACRCGAFRAGRSPASRAGRALGLAAAAPVRAQPRAGEIAITAHEVAG